MKKTVFGISILVGSILFTGCASKGSGLLGVQDNGIVKEQYSPMYIDKLQESELAYVKSAENLIIVSVDGTRISPFYEVMLGQGADSIKIKEGSHTLMGFLGVDINIRKVFLQAGHEYFIDYTKKPGNYGRTKIHYWIKDLTDDKVVYGKEVN